MRREADIGQIVADFRVAFRRYLRPVGTEIVGGMEADPPVSFQIAGGPREPHECADRRTGAVRTDRGRHSEAVDCDADIQALVDKPTGGIQKNELVLVGLSRKLSEFMGVAFGDRALDEDEVDLARRHALHFGGGENARCQKGRRDDRHRQGQRAAKRTAQIHVFRPKTRPYAIPLSELKHDGGLACNHRQLGPLLSLRNVRFATTPTGSSMTVMGREAAQKTRTRVGFGPEVAGGGICYLIPRL